MLTVMITVPTDICKPNFWGWFFRLKKLLHLLFKTPRTCTTHKKKKKVFFSAELLIAFSLKLIDYQHHPPKTLHTSKKPQIP